MTALSVEAAVETDVIRLAKDGNDVGGEVQLGKELAQESLNMALLIGYEFSDANLKRVEAEAALYRHSPTPHRILPATSALLLPHHNHHHSRYRRCHCHHYLAGAVFVISM